MHVSPPEPLEAVPAPGIVRTQLGRRLREVALLRRLLRLAEAIHRDCPPRSTTDPDSETSDG